MLMQAIPDTTRICDEGLKKHVEDVQLTKHLERAKSAYSLKIVQDRGQKMESFGWGVFTSNMYPWVPADMRTRDHNTILADNETFRLCSTNLEILDRLLLSAQELWACLPNSGFGKAKRS